MSSISIVAAIFLLAAVFAFWLIMSYKGFVRLRNSAEEAFSTTEVYMKRRRELLSRFVKLAEKSPGGDDWRDILRNVSDAVQLAEAAQSADERILCESAVAETIETLFFALDMDEKRKKDKSYLRLRRQIEEADRNIAQVGSFYNRIAGTMNKRIHMFPSSVVAKMFHFTSYPLIG